MLTSMRRVFSGILVGLIIALLVISFAFFGIDSIFTARQGNTIATVGDSVVDSNRFYRAYQQNMNTLSQQFGQQITPDLAKRLGVDRQTLTDQIALASVEDIAKQLKLGISDEYIAKDLQRMVTSRSIDGSFDADAVRRLLMQMGLTEQTYFETERERLAGDQVVQALFSDMHTPKALEQIKAEYNNNARSLAYIALPLSEVDEISPADQETLANYFETVKTQYALPEYRQIGYVEITVPIAAAKAVVPEEEIRAKYDADPSLYPDMPNFQENTEGEQSAAESTPQPKPYEDVRDLIQAELAEDKARQQVITELEYALDDKVAGGMSLEEAAKEVGLTYLKTPLFDMRLGVKKGENTELTLPDSPNIINTVFNLLDEGQQPEIENLSDSGVAFLEVLKIEDARDQNLDEVEEDVQSAWQLMQRKEVLSQKADEVVKQLSDTQTSLNELAAENGYVIKQADGLTRLKGNGSEISANVLNQLFAHQEGDFFQASAEEGALRIIGKIGETVIASGENTEDFFAQNPIENDLSAIFLTSYQEDVGVSINQTRFEQLTSGGVAN